MGRWVDQLRVVLGTGVLLGAVIWLSCQESATSSDNPTSPAGVDNQIGQAYDEPFVLFFSGNWHGQLEPCGCSEKQLGGIDRRSHILDEIPAARRLLLDAGPLIEAEDRQSQLKLETFLYSLRRLGYDAVGLSAREIDTLRKNIDVDQTLRPPVVVTNMSAAARESFEIVAYLEKTLQAGDKILDCLVLSLTDPAGLSDDYLRQELELQDLYGAVEQTLLSLGIAPDQASGDKLVIVMLNQENQELQERLSTMAALDILVKVGYGDEPVYTQPTSPGPLVLTTGKLGKYLFRIDMAVGSGGETEKAKFQAITIHDTFPTDPAIVSLIDEYQLRMQIEDLVAEYPRQPLPEGLGFAGNRSCASNDCHADVYRAWSQFGHAHAMESLVKVKRQYDPECVSCHTVGMKYVGGYRSLELTPELGNVGCEMCHGPGTAHNDDPLAEYQMIFTPCEVCHDSEHSLAFNENREEYFQKIKHWHEPRRYWE